MVISATKELENGTRAMLLLAEEWFRLDVVISDDTLRAIVRNLSGAELDLEGGKGGDLGVALESGDAALYEPRRSTMALRLGRGEDQIVATISIATLRFVHRGTVRVTAQAVVRRRPVR
jgi:hypothetical protein